MPTRKPLNLSNFLQRQWKRADKDPTRLDLSGKTVTQRQREFLSTQKGKKENY